MCQQLPPGQAVGLWPTCKAGVRASVPGLACHPDLVAPSFHLRIADFQILSDAFPHVSGRVTGVPKRLVTFLDLSPVCIDARVQATQLIIRQDAAHMHKASGKRLTEVTEITTA